MAEPSARAPRPPPSLSAERTAELEELGYPSGSYRFEPADGMRRTIARRLQESFRDVPHFALTVAVDVGPLLAARRAFNAEQPADHAQPTVNDLLIKAAALALVAEPRANVSFVGEGLLHHAQADVAFAVATEGGLMTPLIRDAGSKSVPAIAAEARALARRARARRLRPEEYLGGGFTLSNLGMLGVRTFTSILNPPQACIVSVGACERRPVFRGNTLVGVEQMDLTLNCDHRAVDGAIGARWLEALRAILATPDEWLS